MIGAAAHGFAHRRALLRIAIAAATEHANQLALAERSHGGEHAG